jgi:methyl-galactoside transport system substrate-binding protein
MNDVGLFIYLEDDLFMKSLTEDIQKQASGRFSVLTSYALNSQIIQNEQIEDLLESGSPLLIINPVDRIGAHAIIRKLASRKIPVIFFNREPLEQDMKLRDQVWYVGAKAEQSGRMQAELAMELFGKNPYRLNKYDRNGDGRIQAVILKGEQGHQDAEIRTESVQTAFRERNYRLEVLATEVANWSRREAYERMDFLLGSLENPPELVLSNNDAMAIGAISLMRQRGMFKDTNGNGIVDKDDETWIPVLGIDGVPDAVVQIRDGYLYGTVLNDSAAMAQAIVALADAILAGGIGSDFSWEITDGRYIWVDYKPFKLN